MFAFLFNSKHTDTSNKKQLRSHTKLHSRKEKKKGKLGDQKIIKEEREKNQPVEKYSPTLFFSTDRSPAVSTSVDSLQHVLKIVTDHLVFTQDIY